MDVSKIPLAEVESTNIAAIGHDKSRKILVIKFHNKKRYAFEKVTEEMFAKLKAAESIGSFFHKNIRYNPSYPMTKLDE